MKIKRKTTKKVHMFILDVTSEDGFLCLMPRTEDKRRGLGSAEGNYDCLGLTKKMANELRIMVLTAVSLVCQ